MASNSFSTLGPAPFEHLSQDLEGGGDISLQDRPLGDILKENRDLTDEQVEQIVLYQRKHGIRFGEAAVSLNFASNSEVIWALSQQFHYPYSPHDGPQQPELIAATDPFGEQAEAFRELRSQIMMGVLSATEGRPALALVSPDSGDGKSFFAANLAVAFSQLGNSTLLIDADLRTPRIHAIFGIDGTPGLSNVLSGRSESHVIQRIASLPSLYVMPAGAVPPNPLELVQRPALSLLLHELTRKFDYVIVDTSAASRGADARVTASTCGAALAVCRRGRTKLPNLHGFLKGLRSSSTKLAGVAINEW